MSDNIFRKEYRPLSDEEKVKLEKIKDKAQELLDIYQDNSIRPFSADEARAVAIAKTKLEESVMWAVKGVTG